MPYSIFYLVLISFHFCFSQDTYFSQHDAFPLHTNKAFAGSKGCSRMITGTRLQWLNLDGGYKTYYFSYDQYSQHLKSGIGIAYWRKDFANNFLVTDNVYFAYSPHIPVGKRNKDSLRLFVIKPAFDIGFISHTLDWNKVVFADTYDPYYGAIYGSNEVTDKKPVITAPDVGMGMLIYGKDFSFGYYHHHVTEPDMAVLGGSDVLFARQELHGSYVMRDYKWLGGFVVIPSLLFTWQGILQKMDLGLSATYKKYTLGINARINGSLAFIAGFEHKCFRCGYAYEANTTYARKALGSSHEAVLSFKFFCRKEKKKIKIVH